LPGVHHNCPFPSGERPHTKMGEWAVKQSLSVGQLAHGLKSSSQQKKERIICKIPQRFLEGIGTVLAKSPSLRRKYIT